MKRDDTPLLMLGRFGNQRPVRRIVVGARLVDRKFRHSWKSYLFQSGLYMLALLVILLVVDVVLRAAIVVAIASTAFILFVAPHSQASSPVEWWAATSWR